MDKFPILYLNCRKRIGILWDGISQLSEGRRKRQTDRQTETGTETHRERHTERDPGAQTLMEFPSQGIALN